MRYYETSNFKLPPFGDGTITKNHSKQPSTFSPYPPCGRKIYENSLATFLLQTLSRFVGKAILGPEKRANLRLIQIAKWAKGKGTLIHQSPEKRANLRLIQIAKWAKGKGTLIHQMSIELFILGPESLSFLDIIALRKRGFGKEILFLLACDAKWVLGLYGWC
ncbi:hypothetical protein CEXT_620501 [Caerostris extrusa]|uniref:Uncharacterized protein n=1 Tax=Caerostris extrusa TaxID=172846 RepID=A0AAV4QPA2_CAEEX|nr:hypothetical protein CEXT_620501 [Caerostris extrusa]